MVDFNNDSTIGTPALDIVRVLVLERRYNVMESIEEYVKLQDSGIDDLSKEIAIIKGRLLSFYYEIQEATQRHLSKEELQALGKNIKSNNFEDLTEAFYILNKLLDKLTITKLDTRQALPPMIRPELRNQAKGR